MNKMTTVIKVIIVVTLYHNANSLHDTSGIKTTVESPSLQASVTINRSEAANQQSVVEFQGTVRPKPDQKSSLGTKSVAEIREQTIYKK